MKSQALPEFWAAFGKLPPKIQTTARKNYDLWQQHPGLKSLEFKKIKDDLWSIRAVRATAPWAQGWTVSMSGFGSGRTMNTNACYALFDGAPRAILRPPK
jgi:hypothetical protein